MVLADSPLACMRRTNPTFDLSSALGRLRCPRALGTWVSSRIPSMCEVGARLFVRCCGGVRSCGGCSFGGGDVLVHRC
jgi:hypothetical protein